MKATSGQVFVSLTLLSGTFAYVANDHRQEVVGRCHAVKVRDTFMQLKACNAFLRNEEGCVMPPSGSFPDRSCLNKAQSDLVYQSCLEEQSFWGKSMSVQAGPIPILGPGRLAVDS